MKRCMVVVAILFGLASIAQAQQETLKVGDAAPDFEIQTLESDKMKLSDHFGDDGKPVILLFSRANW